MHFCKLRISLEHAIIVYTTGYAPMERLIMKMCRRTIAIGMAFGMLVTSMPRGVFADEILVEEDTDTIEENIGIVSEQEMDVPLDTRCLSL